MASGLSVMFIKAVSPMGLRFANLWHTRLCSKLSLAVINVSSVFLPTCTPWQSGNVVYISTCGVAVYLIMVLVDAK
ncbi:hypothetical protein PVK06_027626 [Gossypium arboreum]|uniref:Uncharacterized protein n=1 Tax=Gossypium arboreum TaxID=29729 RepID=A0ABR0P0U8_GOSAR|nr:hypothetical protein PVK06_027626 [Gossypium arboreum]